MAGTFEKRGENSYRLVYSLGTGEHRKKHYKTIRIEGSTEREREKIAKRELSRFVDEIDAGAVYGKVPLIADFADQWMESSVGVLSPSSIEFYTSFLKNRIVPEFGHLRLDKIRPMVVQRWFAELATTDSRLDGRPGPISATSIGHIHSTLRAMFSAAVNYGLIESNPIQRVKKPKKAAKMVQHIDESDLPAILQALQSEEPEFMRSTLLALITGMRRGEVAGLRFGAVDFRRGILRICESAVVHKGRTVLQTPKGNHLRHVSIPPEMGALLEEQYHDEMDKKDLLGTDWTGPVEPAEQFVFSGLTGDVMHPSTLYSRWVRFLEKNDFPHIPYHGLRHTSASYLIARGIDLAAVSKRLGHSRISTTSDIYIHASEYSDHKSALAFGGFVAPSEKMSPKMSPTGKKRKKRTKKESR